ncbi:TY-Chap domain-containing protein [Actinomadura oligospora]|uniref:TY-Chap domain-containing protein n=1 Tax=Actinomadura oligospora TaxID=111804 RepID=UPI0004B3701F|nr:hypothetical protein [Actinomadura oligospora]
MDWQEFAEQLAEDLSLLSAGTLLVIEERPEDGRYAQFVQEDDKLLAYVADNRYMTPADKVTPEGERVIEEAGWHRAEPGRAHDDWWQELPWPASGTAYRHLTEAIVVALRDGYGIASPEGWRYRAWNEREANAPVTLARLSLPQVPAR